MGATRPLVLQSSMVDSPDGSARLSLLNGINTAGGVTGGLLAGCFLIGGLGIAATSRLAAIVNLSIGAVAVVMAYRRPAPVQHLPPGTAATGRSAGHSAAGRRAG